MQCIEPGLLSDDELLAAALGDASDLARRHLAACASCARIATNYAREDRALHVRLARLECPSALALGDLALGMLDLQEAAVARRHLALCPHCTAELHVLSTELAGDPLADLAIRPGLLRRLLATLVPAQVQGYAMTGVRGTSHDEPLTYEAEDVTVSLTTQVDGHGANRSWILLGLVDVAGTAPDAATEVRLVDASGSAKDMQLDQFGNFSAGGLQPGLYTVELRFPDRLIAIEAVEISNATP